MTAPGRRPLARVGSVAWLLPTLAFGLLTWVSFLYIGLRTRHRPWLAWSGVYLVVVVLAVVLSPGEEQSDGLAGALSALGIVLVFVGGFVHAVVVHKRYALWRRHEQARAQLVPPWQPSGASTPQRGLPQLGMPDVEQQWFGPSPASPPSVPSQPPAPAFPLDLNTATVEELAVLPAVGPVLARRLVVERTARGRFASVEELLDLGYAPHVVAVLRRHVEVPAGAAGSQQTPSPAPRARGRVLDV